MLTFVETTLFTSLVGQYLSDDEYAALQQALTANPEAGDVIRGSGGVRKVRWESLAAASGAGFGSSTTCGHDRARCGSRSRSMPTAKRNVGREILEGLRQLKRGEHGRVTTVPSVATIREGTGLSQPRFAQLLGVSVRTLQEWEQGRRAPSGAARTLLLIAAKNPGALLDVA